MIRSSKKARAHQNLVKDADAWVKSIVLARQGPACLKCGQEKPLQAAHILGKGANPSLRYDLENVIGLCLKDHIFWAHKDPAAFVEWVETIFPGRLAVLRERAQYRCKIDLKELICVLKSIYKSLPAKARGAGLPPGTTLPYRPIEDDSLPF